MPPVPEIADTPSKVNGMIRYLESQKRFAWDHETRSIDFASDPNGALNKLTMRTDLVSFATPHRAFVCPLGLKTLPVLDEEEFFALIKPLMENPDFFHEGYNCPFDMHAQANYGVWVQSFEDIMVAAWLLDENRPKTLKDRCTDVGMSLTPYDFKTYWKARALLCGEMDPPKRGVKVTWDELKDMEQLYLQYSAEDSIATSLLSVVYRQRLAEDPRLETLFYHHRNPGVRTVFNMERRGLPMDRKYLVAQSEICKADLDKAEAAVYREAGKHFEIGSTIELSKVLYQDMGLPVYKTTKGGANSTARDTLDHLAQDGHSIAATLVRWRTVSKMYTTYLAPDSKLVQAIYPWGHLHPSFNVVGTDTGRLSSSGPNAQNFPRNSDETYNFRKSFIADPGYSLVGGDYSQIELRIMAHMSQCQAMMDEYRKDYELQQAIMRGDDIKAMLKAGLFTKSDIHQKTADACRCSRQLAKNINFGLLYGMGAEKLALVLTEANWDACVEKGLTWDPACDVVTKELAKEFIDLFFGMYPEIRHYQKAVGEYAKRNGNVRTRYGQLRRLPDVYASDPYLVHAACRQAVNTTIQGHVGELMLHCMNRIERDEELRDYGFRMFLQVHDELLGEVPHKWVKPTQIKLAKILQMPSESTDAFMHYGYRVPLVFEPCAGPDWATVH